MFIFALLKNMLNRFTSTEIELMRLELSENVSIFRSTCTLLSMSKSSKYYLIRMQIECNPLIGDNENVPFLFLNFNFTYFVLCVESIFVK